MRKMLNISWLRNLTHLWTLKRCFKFFKNEIWLTPVEFSHHVLWELVTSDTEMFLELSFKTLMLHWYDVKYWCRIAGDIHTCRISLGKAKNLYANWDWISGCALTRQMAPVLTAETLVTLKTKSSEPNYCSVFTQFCLWEVNNAKNCYQWCRSHLCNSTCLMVSL